MSAVPLCGQRLNLELTIEHLDQGGVARGRAGAGGQLEVKPQRFTRSRLLPIGAELKAPHRLGPLRRRGFQGGLEVDARGPISGRAGVGDVLGRGALAQQQAVQEALLRAREEIDAIEQIGALIAAAPAGDSGSAYAVWSRTSLASARLTSEIELFDADRRLLSRFALNVPEYPYGESAPVWTGGGCAWDVFGEVARSGAVERVMLHAERGICDAAGRLIGAVVVHNGQVMARGGNAMVASKDATQHAEMRVLKAAAYAIGGYSAAEIWGTR